MKVRSEREKTKVVIRHLPPSLTQSDLFQHIDSHFASRYNWFSFRPGNNRYQLPFIQTINSLATITSVSLYPNPNPNPNPYCSHTRQRHSRAYIDFKCPDDVFEFAEFFDGHVFVNERGILFLYFISLTLHPLEWHRFYTGMYVQSGAQHKVIVEYAPSQRVPKPSAKKDGREGTIFKGWCHVNLIYVKCFNMCSLYSWLSLFYFF